MSYKRLIPCIFIQKGEAVKWFQNKEVIAKNPVNLAKQYSDNGADELIIFDLSTTDEEQDEAVDLIKKINRVIGIPMIVGGNIKRQEDVEKLLFAGAKRVMINLSKPEMLPLIEDISGCFGKSKIAASLNDFDALFKHQKLIEEYVDDLIFMHRLDLNSVMNVTDIPCIIVTDTEEEQELLDILKCPGVKGLSGRFVSNTAMDFSAFKERCIKENIKMTYDSKRDKATLLSDKEEEGGERDTHRIFECVYDMIADRKKNPKAGSYTNYLFEKGVDKILGKIGEDVTEIIIASKNPNPEEIKYPIADFLYHMMALMVERGVTWEEVAAELSDRQ